MVKELKWFRLHRNVKLSNQGEASNYLKQRSSNQGEAPFHVQMKTAVIATAVFLGISLFIFKVQKRLVLSFCET